MLNFFTHAMKYKMIFPVGIYKLPFKEWVARDRVRA